MKRIFDVLHIHHFDLISLSRNEFLKALRLNKFSMCPLLLVAVVVWIMFFLWFSVIFFKNSLNTHISSCTHKIVNIKIDSIFPRYNNTFVKNRTWMIEMLNIDCICKINCIAALQKLTFTNLQFSKHNFKFNIYKLTMVSTTSIIC